jgi:N-carbamoylputrescine amidase
MKILFYPGDLGFKTIPYKRKIGTLICWDQWYPEGSIDCLKWVRVLFYPTAIGWHQERKSNMVKPIRCLDEYERTCGSKWGICCCGNRIGLEQYYLIQQE